LLQKDECFGLNFWHTVKILSCTVWSTVFWPTIVWILPGMCHECVIRRILIIRRIVFNAYFTVLNKSGHILRLRNMAKFAEFWLFRQFPPRKRPFSELPMLFYKIIIPYNILEKNWNNTYFTVLNIPTFPGNLHMANHPGKTNTFPKHSA